MSSYSYKKNDTTDLLNSNQNYISFQFLISNEFYKVAARDN